MPFEALIAIFNFRANGIWAINSLCNTFILKTHQQKNLLGLMDLTDELPRTKNQET